MIPNIIVSIIALPKTGKNHLAYSWPDPMKVYCFNGGADFVARKFKGKKIEVQNFVLPIVDSSEEQWALPVWEEFYPLYNKDVGSGNYQTVIFDTGTEIENFCQQAVLEELQAVAEGKNKTKYKLSTNEYLSRNLRMNALFARARNNGVNLVTLQYLKEQWVKEKGSDKAEPTGAFVLDGWKQTEAQCDVNIELTAKVVGGKPVTIATIKQNRFDRRFNGAQLQDPTYDELCALLFEEGE